MRALWGVVVLVACSSTPPKVNPTGVPGCTVCSDVCIDVQVDDTHCGNCNRACGTGESCAAGECFPTSCASMPCDPSQVCYQSACTDKRCVGVVCPQGQTCSEGACACAANHALCGTACVDPKTDDANCGSCGKACAANESCAAGACLPDACPQLECDPLSVCYQGGCAERACVGVVCPSGQSCHAGACGCGNAELECSGRCVRPSTDSANCGACGKTCAAGTACANGACLPSSCGTRVCNAGEVCSLGACIEAACVGVVCPSGLVCKQGLCDCAPGDVACGGHCATVRIDEQNCGACGATCAATERCAGGQCLPKNCPSMTCDPTSACFMNMCADADCVGVTCPASQTCKLGACTCTTPLFACGGVCVDTATSPQHCGGCNQPCTVGTCVGGVCRCMGAGVQLCSAICKDTANDPMNCGMCGRVCAPNQTCVAGACACAPGLRLCNGTCLDVTADNANCGNCNVVCTTGQFCVASACRAAFTCQAAFNPPGQPDCPYLPLNDANCGAETVVNTMQLTGTSTGLVAVDLVPAPVAQLFVAQGNLGGGGPTQMEFVLDGGALLVNDTTAGLRTLSVTTNPYFCDNPQAFNLRGAGPYNISLTRYAKERFNTGSISMLAPAPLSTRAASDGGTIVCDHRCGAFHDQGCADLVQVFGMTLPAGRSAISEARGVQNRGYGIFNGPDTLYVDAYTAAGQFICSLVSDSVYFTPADARGRIVNNTGVDQPILLRVHTAKGVDWQFDIATEP